MDTSNPYAFPKGEHHPSFHEYRGMTLRDWFAGQFLAGYGAPDSPAEVARLAYRLADAMLAARGDQ